MLNIEGPLGKKSLNVDLEMFNIDIAEGKEISIKPKKVDQNSKRLWGMNRSLIKNAVIGSSAGYEKILEFFTELDDYDVLGAIKVWNNHSDKVLAELCNMLVNRQLLKVQIQKEEFSKEEIEKHIQLASKHYAISEEEANYFVFNNNIENNAYNPEMDRINILFKDGSVMDITEASDNFNVQALSMTVRKYFLCYPSISG